MYWPETLSAFETLTNEAAEARTPIMITRSFSMARLSRPRSPTRAPLTLPDRCYKRAASETAITDARSGEGTRMPTKA